MGWIPDYPDFRDYDETTKDIKQELNKIRLTPPQSYKMKPSVDLKQWFSDVEDQGNIGSCTANAAVGVFEYFQRRAFGQHMEGSRLFLYKATRNLMGLTGDTGAYLRSSMGAMVLFGIPDEKYWPYIENDYDIEPPAFCYGFAENFKATKYYRLDQQGISKQGLLNRIKLFLAAGLPSMFGFTVFGSISQASQSGEIPFPSQKENYLGGHAVTTAGYDDSKKIKNQIDGKETTGAFLIRNSWGTSWGDNGYGWLPYEYILQGIAIDWWSVIKTDWVDTGKFGI